jgi:hypothetical protein
MQPADAFKEILKQNALALRAYGFSRSGLTFYLREAGNWGVINFQKSKDSSARGIVFTVNLGIASTRLLAFFSHIRPGMKPSIWDCHWRQRLGYLLPNHSDVWWTINSTTLVDDLGQEIQGYVVNFGVPELKEYISDETLRDLWLSGSAPGLTDFQRLMNVSVLLKALGSLDGLDPVLKELQRVSAGKPSAVTAEIHIQRLKSSK